MAMCQRIKLRLPLLEKGFFASYSLASGTCTLQRTPLSNPNFINAERSFASSTPVKEDNVKNTPQNNSGHVIDPRRNGGPPSTNIGQGNFSLVKPVFFPKKNLKRKIKRIELPSLYAEVSYRTMKAVIFYGPHKDHLPRDVRSGLKVISPASDWPDW